MKAQIHSGARGKAGGIKLCETYHEVHEAATGLFGKHLVTKQTGPEGKVVQRVYVEVAESFERELYLGIVLDRKAERVRVIATAQGGMDIEEIVQTSPDAVLQTVVEPAVGLQQFQARELAFGLGLNIKQVSRAVAAIMGAYRAFRDLDATMVEINPLVVTKDDRVIALDAKISFDDNGLFRHPHVSEMRDAAQEDPREAEAAQFGLNYVGLEGDIGCIINGAGLAMATMDTIKYAGGEPANFLDVGGGASPERVAAAFRLVLSDPNVSRRSWSTSSRASIAATGWPKASCRPRKIGIQRAARRPPCGHQRRTGAQDRRAKAGCRSSPPTRCPTRRKRRSRPPRRIAPARANREQRT